VRVGEEGTPLKKLIRKFYLRKTPVVDSVTQRRHAIGQECQEVRSTSEEASEIIREKYTPA
jgi:hypothetical protein